MSLSQLNFIEIHLVRMREEIRKAVRRFCVHEIVTIVKLNFVAKLTIAPHGSARHALCPQVLFAYQWHGAHSLSKFLVASGATLVFNAIYQV